MFVTGRKWLKEGFNVTPSVARKKNIVVGKLPSIGHIGSTLWIMTMSMYDSCSLTSEACTDSIMCFRDSPRPSVLSRMVDIINLCYVTLTEKNDRGFGM